MFVAHIGDSHAVLGFRPMRASSPLPSSSETSSSSSSPSGVGNNAPMVGEWLTVPHKPDTPSELQRIEQAGGCLIYLHRGKAFLRGGDFHNRDHAMQLNYCKCRSAVLHRRSCVRSKSHVCSTRCNTVLVTTSYVTRLNSRTRHALPFNHSYLSTILHLTLCLFVSIYSTCVWWQGSEAVRPFLRA
jgi:hypothetical protein